ncbi:nucleotide-diphospho-sugar transferase [Tribonema minus]|uniref:UTP-monosaccharide-1-phosphate uridylyltransferase n=1 Tax=Tribonema minus TaxID=303371 RepID=A0A836CDZ7_9STRA|nr:nucleotide-diphospho-sugar transferase [Tribonema minus]
MQDLKNSLDSNTQDLKGVLGSNVDILSAEEAAMANTLLELGQQHLLEDWPQAGELDDRKHALLQQALHCDAQYPGGLAAYVSKARRLLRDSAEGVNPFEGYTPEGANPFEGYTPEVDAAPLAEGVNPFEGYPPEMADGEALEFGTPEFEAMEKAGLGVAGQTGFVLVAGGLGERLGFNGIKLSLPVETATGRTYLELYAQYILELQRRARAAPGADQGLLLPLIIMTSEGLLLPLIITTSEDTDAATKELLQTRNHFGMDPSQVKIVMQGKVPALGDSDASLVTQSGDRFALETKPHGHGDVHHLLHRSGIAEDLKSRGFKYLVFFQDTNALVLNSILPTLGVSATKGYAMNSICVPRKAQEAAGAVVAQEAAGAIVALTHTDGSSLIINVEYNQLDPLLRATVSPEGDVNDPETGFSPYPGNTNNIVFELGSYVKTLQGKDEGVVVEFVNPKYKDASRTAFKKPTRLECMMQDFPKLMAQELDQSDFTIGFTSLEKWLSFSPAKNSLEAGAAGAPSGVPPNTASSAEAEFYAQNVRRVAATAGAAFGAPRHIEFEGVPLDLGPLLVLSPSFAITTNDIRRKFGKDVKVSTTSALVLEGPGITVESLDLDGPGITVESLDLDGEAHRTGSSITVESLDLDGALVIKACEDARVTVHGLTVRNEGWHPAPLPAEGVPEVDRVRGFVLDKRAATVIEGVLEADRVCGFVLDKKAATVTEVLPEVDTGCRCVLGKSAAFAIKATEVVPEVDRVRGFVLDKKAATVIEGVPEADKVRGFVLDKTAATVIEVDRVRRFALSKKAATVIEISEPGDWVVGPDGSISRSQ